MDNAWSKRYNPRVEDIQEIHKLHKMLLAAQIEHEFLNRSMVYDDMSRAYGWQILVFDKNGDRLVSAIEGAGTYGVEVDRIEIMGLLTPEESIYDSVAGGLTAEDVLNRIKVALNN